MNTRRWLATGLLVVLALACSALAIKKDALIFSHKLHVTDNEIACADCHKGIGDADAVDAIEMPGHDTCWGCHEDGEETCTKCHVDPDNVVAKPRAHTPGLVFSHSLHVDATEGDCQACHKGMDASEPGHVPAKAWTHQACMTCHRDQYRDVKCAMCHGEMEGWKDKPWGVFNHDGAFTARHGLLARSEAVVCQHCHSEESCQRCHDHLQPTRASVRDRMDMESAFVHRGDYLSRHAMEAGLDRMACYTCHESRTCSECHQKSGVTRAGAAFKHPEGWMTAGSASHHGRDARKKIGLCAGCHDKGEATNCLACHRPGGPGGNPHPGREMDSSLDRRTDMPCRMCH